MKLSKRKANKLRNKIDGDIHYDKPLKNVLHVTECLITFIILIFIALGAGYSMNIKATATPTYHNVYELGLYTEDSNNGLHLNYNNKEINKHSSIRQMAQSQAMSGDGYLAFKFKKSLGMNIIKNTQSNNNTKQNTHMAKKYVNSLNH